MPIPTVTPLPDHPLRNDPNFSTEAAAWVTALAETYTPELNALPQGIIDASAAAAPTSVSTTSVAIGLGAKSFTVETGKTFTAGQFVVAADVAAPTTNRMLAEVTSYDSSTGALVLNVTRVWGSGTKTSWTIALSGPQGEGLNWTNPAITGTLREDFYTITDGASVDIDPANGSYQRWTLGANRTFTMNNMGEGDAIVVKIADGTAYAITPPTTVWVGGVAATLPTSGFALIVWWKDGSTLYAKYCGSVAS